MVIPTFPVSESDKNARERRSHSFWRTSTHVHVRYMLSPVRLSVVCLTVCRQSVTLVHSNQAVEIFGNISMAFGTLAIR